MSGQSPKARLCSPKNPILEIVAPLPEAQIAETFVMNQVHFQTVAASKAARVVHAAQGRTVIDFGLRRMHAADAGIKGARAFWIAGVAGTSNVLAGRIYDIPVAGTMAHSYVQAHEHEADAFRQFAALYPHTTLLVDTYDTLAGVQRVVELAQELGDAFAISAVRLDSGDLGALAIAARRILDDAGLQAVELFASGALDEHAIRALLARGAPINGFGVGSLMGTSADVPHLDIAFKLSSYAGRGRVKLSVGKRILPGRKQVFRRENDGEPVRDVIALADEMLEGRPLLAQVMRQGERLPAGVVTLADSRALAQRELSSLPERVRDLTPAQPPYTVMLSEKLEALWHEVSRRAAD